MTGTKPLIAVPWPSPEALSRAGEMIGLGATAATRAGVAPPEGELDRLLFELGRTRGQALTVVACVEAALDAAADLAPRRPEGAVETDRAATMAERVARLAALAREVSILKADIKSAADRRPELEKALRNAIRHIEHMARWIGDQKAGYSFEDLGEDIADIRAPLESAAPARSDNP